MSCRVAMPGRGVKEDDRTGRTPGENFVGLWAEGSESMAEAFLLVVRARDKSRGAVVGSELVHHQDEPEHWPCVRAWRHVDVEFLGRYARWSVRAWKALRRKGAQTTR